jgi:hypothetical protein
MISVNRDNAQSFIDEKNYNRALVKAKAGYESGSRWDRSGT